MLAVAPLTVSETFHAPYKEGATVARQTDASARGLAYWVTRAAYCSGHQGVYGDMGVLLSLTTTSGCS